MGHNKKINFDFRIIEKEYPKAFWCFAEWMHHNFYGHSSIIGVQFLKDGSVTNKGLSNPSIFNPLYLDFFFDEQGIHGYVQLDLAWGWHAGRTMFLIESIHFHSFNEGKPFLYAKRKINHECIDYHWVSSHARCN
jgi:hypothetical protein